VGCRCDARSYSSGLYRCLENGERRDHGHCHQPWADVSACKRSRCSPRPHEGSWSHHRTRHQSCSLRLTLPVRAMSQMVRPQPLMEYVYICVASVGVASEMGLERAVVQGAASHDGDKSVTYWWRVVPADAASNPNFCSIDTWVNGLSAAEWFVLTDPGVGWWNSGSHCPQDAWWWWQTSVTIEKTSAYRHNQRNRSHVQDWRSRW